MKDDCSVKVNLVDGKENKGSKLADKSVRAYLDIEKAKEMLGNGSGTSGLVLLDDYITFDTMTFEGKMDVESVMPLIEEGGHIYAWNFWVEEGASLQFVYTSAYIDSRQNMLKFVSPVIMSKLDTQCDFETFTLSVPISDGIFGFDNFMISDKISASFINNGSLGGFIKNKQALTIKVNGQTYTYDGSQAVEINIS